MSERTRTRRRGGVLPKALAWAILAGLFSVLWRIEQMWGEAALGVLLVACLTLFGTPLVYDYLRGESDAE